MTNGVTKRPHSEAQYQFIEQFSSLLAPWGLPPSAGRVYGYLLLHQTPISLDQIAADLEISKAGTWNVAKELESFGHIRRYSVPGSKRALYAPSGNFAQAIAKQAALLGEMSALLEDCASHTATQQAAPKLQEQAHFYQAIQQAMASTIDEFNGQKDQ